jgi:oligoendopeptidase F
VTAGAAQGRATGAEGVRYDLSALVADAAAARRVLDDAVAKSERLGASYAGRVAGLAPAELADLLAARGRLDDVVRLFGEEGYTMLRRSADAGDVEAADLDGYAQPLLQAIGTALQFLEDEWSLLDGAARERLAAGLPAPARRYLERIARRAAARLEPAAERALAAREPSASRAWLELQRATLASRRARCRGEERTLEELRALQRSGDAALRGDADAALAEALEGCADTIAACYDAVVADRLAIDRLRRRSDPMAAALVEDELPGAVVEAALEAVERRRAVAVSWWRAKARLLGLPRLRTADILAPLPAAPPLPFAEARTTLVQAFARLDPGLGAEVDAVFAERRIDAELRDGKDGSIFCAHPVSDGPGYVFCTYAGDAKGLYDLAHELGHALAFARAGRAHGPLGFAPGLALCEVPSTFAELVALERVATRRDLVASWLDGCVDLVWWAADMCRFEQDLCTRRAAGETLTAGRIGEAWGRRVEWRYGDAVEVSDAIRREWVYASHVVGDRFYNYAYVLAYLVALSLLDSWRADPAAFAARFVPFLGAGDVEPPAAQLARLGIDLASPATWERGLDVLAELVEQAAGAAA